MTNLEKLDALKAFLTESGFPFIEKKAIKSKIVIDLLVLKYNVAVHLSDENDQLFFKKTRCHYHPFFIRENETVEFIIEKMQNCIMSVLMELQRNFEKKTVVEEKPRRKRVRIKAVRV